MIKFLRRFEHVPSGNGTTIALATVLAIYSLSVVTSLPGLAIAPILGDLEKVFPDSSQLKIQMLESLPSLVIVPFILLSGTLSVRFNKHMLLMSGLGIFFLSSILYLVSKNLDFMLVNSVLLGVGAGMVIPLSTGLIADYFGGAMRTRQLGIVSAISNLSLVGATMLAGFLAGIGWHYAFLVYCISIVSIILARNLRPSRDGHKRAADTAVAPDLSSSGVIKTSVHEPNKWLLRLGLRTYMPIGLMLFYFLITTIVLVVPFNISVFIGHFHANGAQISGTVISVFFLSITLPGFFINRIINSLGPRIDIGIMGVMCLGLFVLLLGSHIWAMWVGVMLVGVSYGTLQPLIYDRTASYVSSDKVTLALSLVMSMNYIAIILYPFVQQLIGVISFSSSIYVPFVASVLMALIYVGFHIRNLRKVQ